MTFADPYRDPGTGVLLNNFDISDPRVCEAAEARLSALRIAELELTPLPGLYDLPHLCRFHRHIFGDLYPWAGKVRRVDIARTAPFASWRQIEPYASGLFEELRKEQYLRGLARAELLDRLAHYYVEVNALHPFREGNGRAQRAFFAQLLLEAGWRLDLTALDREAFVAACRLGMSGPSEPLRSLFEDVLVPA
ncbi:putative adenosine monophosphate-protein transferase Fic [Saccharothrix violaceirubra]|uniref:protein adenylyltransferase n=1 Tax=Saccharothrix violaceirubra TaxID=413306 RepID=A0A7W7SY42_9PSEU|nr:Fic family protein [Saccharothrix violaceirubra]MBB4963069.1 cell filamentation protein [Saccharothrix violaceirubra]